MSLRWGKISINTIKFITREFEQKEKEQKDMLWGECGAEVLRWSKVHEMWCKLTHFDLLKWFKLAQN